MDINRQMDFEEEILSLIRKYNFLTFDRIQSLVIKGDNRNNILVEADENYISINEALEVATEVLDLLKKYEIIGANPCLQNLEINLKGNELPRIKLESLVI